MVNIFDVAHYILNTNGGEMSTVKLQKLCYYAQAWHLAKHGIPLFPEEFEKWDNGPVCRDLYKVHRGKLSINAGNVPGEWCWNEELSSKECSTIEYVLVRYGILEGDELSDLTHQEDPWKLAEKNAVIPKKVMEEYYFDRWGEEGDLSKDVIVSREKLEGEMAAVKDSPIYQNAGEMFKKILGHEVSSKVLS
jgi:uncharacterized phage-associated protein